MDDRTMKTTTVLLVLLLVFMPLEARSQIFKCTEEDGSTTYRQTPCPSRPSTEVRSPTSSRAALDCRYASRFAKETATLMHNGAESDDVFDRYGGLYSMGKESLGIVNYVYTFRTSDDISADRIAGLARAKCEAQAFGNVSCEVLPLSFTEELGGCDADEEGDAAGDEDPASDPESNPTGELAGEPAAGIEPLSSAFPTGAQQASSVGPAAPATTQAGSDPEQVRQCKKRFRDAIDAVDAEMRQGYSSEQGEAYRERLRTLTSKLRACE